MSTYTDVVAEVNFRAASGSSRRHGPVCLDNKQIRPENLHFPSPLHKCLKQLSKFKSASQVPRLLFDRLFNAVFSSYLDGPVQQMRCRVESLDCVIVTPVSESQKIIVSPQRNSDGTPVCFDDVFSDKRVNAGSDDDDEYISCMSTSPSIVTMPIAASARSHPHKPPEQDGPLPLDNVFERVFGYPYPTTNSYLHTLVPMLPSSTVRNTLDGINVVVLGQGVFGRVSKATLSVSPGEHQDVAVKEPFMDKCVESDIIKEATVAMYLQPTGFVPVCYGLLRDDDMGTLKIISELFGCSLYGHLCQRQLLENEWLNIACQIAKGLTKVHQMGILMNDLKPDNVLVNLHQSGPRVKLCDMGSASSLSGIRYQCHENMDKCLHLAPEVRASHPTSMASDVYSVGIIIMEIYIVSDIQGLLPISDECMDHNQDAGLTLSRLEFKLTELYNRELLSPSSLDLSLSGYDADSELESSQHLSQDDGFLLPPLKCLSVPQVGQCLNDFKMMRSCGQTVSVKTSFTDELARMTQEKGIGHGDHQQSTVNRVKADIEAKTDKTTTVVPISEPSLAVSRPETGSMSNPQSGFRSALVRRLTKSVISEFGAIAVQALTDGVLGFL